MAEAELAVGGCAALPGALWAAARVRCNCDGSLSAAFYDTADCRSEGRRETYLACEKIY